MASREDPKIAVMALPPTIWTVGHSNHELETLLELLESERIDYVVDVRSHPYSRHAPQFNRETLEPAVKRREVGYVFLGAPLGGRPGQREHLDQDGHALYGRMAQTPAFQAAIERLMRGATEHRLALLCSCGQPQDCHRRLLIGKVLCERGAKLRHILRDGSIQDEQHVALSEVPPPQTLFGHDEPVWRSSRSVSPKQRLSTSSRA
jgi:uncharacterized protein (DUF488 family)